jgi:hypothetical protein
MANRKSAMDSQPKSLILHATISDENELHAEGAIYTSMGLRHAA